MTDEQRRPSTAEPVTEAGRVLYEALHNDERWIIDSPEPIVAVELEAVRLFVEEGAERDRLEAALRRLMHYTDAAAECSYSKECDHRSVLRQETELARAALGEAEALQGTGQ